MTRITSYNVCYTKLLRIDLAIEKTRAFFESLGVKTRLAEHDVAKEDISKMVQALEAHGMTALSESGDLDLSVSRQILEDAYA